MACTIQDYLGTFAAGTGAFSPQQGNIVAAPDRAPLFIYVSSVWYLLQYPHSRTASSNPVTGLWTHVLPYQASESDPNTAKWTITLPDGTAYYGAVPSVAGPLTLKQLKDTYSWNVVSPTVVSTISVLALPTLSPDPAGSYSNLASYTVNDQGQITLGTEQISISLPGTGNASFMQYGAGASASVSSASAMRFRYNQSTDKAQVSLNGAAYVNLDTGSDIAIGDTVVTGTANSVLFVGTSSGLAQDATNFVWDRTNFRLGLGINAPTERLHVSGNCIITGKLTVGGAIDPTSLTLDAGGSNNAYFESAAGQSAAVSGASKGRLAYNAATQRWQLSENTGAYVNVLPTIGQSVLSATAGSVFFAGTSGVFQQNNALFYWDNSNTRLALGHNSPTKTLHVVGTALISSTLSSGAFDAPSVSLTGGSSNAFIDSAAGQSAAVPDAGHGRLIYNSSTQHWQMSENGDPYINLMPTIGQEIESASGGSILFIGSLGALQQDNVNLYWNDSTDCLGIRTNSPGQALELGGTSPIAYLNGVVSNVVLFNTNGTGAPTYTSRSTGAKVAIYPGGTFSSKCDMGLGAFDTASMYIGVPQDTGTSHIYSYAGTLEIADLRNFDAGASTYVQSFRVGSSSRQRVAMFAGSTAAAVEFDSAGPLAFLTASNTNVGVGTGTRIGTLFANGNFNLGATTSDPSIRLRIEASASAAGIELGNGGSTSVSGSSIGRLIYDSGTQHFKISENTGAYVNVLPTVGQSVLSGTAGSILFVGSGPVLSQNNSELFWNDGSRLFGIGTSASPAATVDVTQKVATSGTPIGLRLTGAAHTTLTASAEIVDADFALNRIVQRSTGAVTTQRAALFRAPTYSFSGASVVTNAATVAITGAPIAGTNATLTNAYALWVQGGKSNFDSDVRIDGKLTVTGAIDPTSLSLVGTSSDAFIDNAAGQSAAVSASNHGRLVYNASTQHWQMSENGGAYVNLLPTIGQTVVSATAGSVLFAGTSGVLQQDNASLFFDDGNNRLGIRTATPGQALELGGTSPVFYLNGATSNFIEFNTNGSAVPAFTTRSAGEKLTLNPTLSASKTSYAIGCSSNTMWFSTEDNTTASGTRNFSYYGGTTEVGRFTSHDPSGAGTYAHYMLVGSSSAKRIAMRAGTGSSVLEFDSSTNFGILSNSNANVGLATGTILMTVTSGGLVGVGNFTPTGRFGIKGHANFTLGEIYFDTAGVATADATVTAIYTITLADNVMYWVEAQVLARGTGGSNRGSYKRFAHVYRQGGGATMGAVTALHTDETAGAVLWDCSIGVSGNDVRVIVTGAAATTINWICSVAWQGVSLTT